MPRVAITVLFAFVLWGAAFRAAGADPVSIMSGYLDMGRSHGALRLDGTQGFAFSRGVDVFEGHFAPAIQCWLPCAPGTELSLRASWSGSDLNGPVSFRGGSYLAGSREAGLLVEFGGSVPLPPSGTGVTTVHAPFVFSGVLSYQPFLDFTQPGASVALVGLGTAAVHLRAVGVGGVGTGPNWTLEGVRYEFAPIPEPSTMLLVGTTLAGGAWYRRRRLRRTDSRSS